MLFLMLLIPIFTFSYNTSTQFVYQSTLNDTNNYIEKYDITTFNNTKQLITIKTKDKKTTLTLLDKADYNYTCYHTPHKTLFFTNENTPIFTLTFPEFQLRSFILGNKKSQNFLYRISETQNPINITVTKKTIKNLVFLEITQKGIPANNWQLIYYFDTAGWITKKELFINEKLIYTSSLKSMSQKNL